MGDRIGDAFVRQAIGCRMLNAPFTAAILDALGAIFDETTRTGARILAWPGEPLTDAMPLRITGGLHALARSGRDDELSALYNAQSGDVANVLSRVLRDWDDWLYPWLDSPPQTNEVGRSGALMPGLMAIALKFGMPIALLEIGASAGLNLNLSRFRYDFGGLAAGDRESPVNIVPEWTGPPPPFGTPSIASRAGVDRNPLDVSDEAIAERLLAYCWPDQPERLARLDAAMALAQQFPPGVETGDAGDWIEQKLAEPQPENEARVVMHSVFWQYLPPVTQARISRTIEAAGARATSTCPLAWLSFEPEPPAIAPMQLILKSWPGGEPQHLATCHPHGTRINWLAPTSD